MSLSPSEFRALEIWIMSMINTHMAKDNLKMGRLLNKTDEAQDLILDAGLDSKMDQVREMAYKILVGD